MTFSHFTPYLGGGYAAQVLLTITFMQDKEFQEQEATAFALFLLMPEPIFSKCIEMMPPIDLFSDHDNGIKKLAEVFLVSESMVRARIELGYRIRVNPKSRF